MSNNFEIKEATTAKEFEELWPVIQHHHPQLKSIQDMLSSLELQRSIGYRLLYCTSPRTPCTDLHNVEKTDPAGGEAVANISSYLGFRIHYTFFTGKTLHIEDLCTLSSERGKGAAGALLDSIIEFALKNGCDQICLDSPYARSAAHRLYLNKGFILDSHHFVLKF